MVEYKIMDKDFKEIMGLALDKATKKGFRRKMYFDMVWKDLKEADYSFMDKKELIDYIVSLLLSVEKICKLIDESKLKERDIKSTKWCMW